jgi:hypothetical protein
MLSSRSALAALLAGLAVLPPPGVAADEPGILARDNLVAWCIVPFDAKKRGPEERAQMLDRLGIRRLAYDWRAEHLPAFDAEVEAMKKHGIELTAWWFPGSLDAEARTILDVIARHKITPQLWVSGGGETPPDETARAARIDAEVQRLKPIAQAAAPLGCKVGLYNHGGWFGHPQTQRTIISRLENEGIRNVGIVYNFHHGHEHLADFAAVWQQMMPKLIALNINGMEVDGDTRGRKILHVGEGDREVDLLRIVCRSGWVGPVGLIDHRAETDSELTLKENLRGLDWVRKEIVEPGSGGPAPFPRRPSNSR